MQNLNQISQHHNHNSTLPTALASQSSILNVTTAKKTSISELLRSFRLRRKAREHHPQRIDDLADDELQLVFSFLDVHSLAAAAATNTRWSQLAMADILWKQLFERDFLKRYKCAASYRKSGRRPSTPTPPTEEASQPADSADAAVNVHVNSTSALIASGSNAPLQSSPRPRNHIDDQSASKGGSPSRIDDGEYNGSGSRSSERWYLLRYAQAYSRTVWDRKLRRRLAGAELAADILLIGYDLLLPFAYGLCYATSSLLIACFLEDSRVKPNNPDDIPLNRSATSIGVTVTTIAATCIHVLIVIGCIAEPLLLTDGVIRRYRERLHAGHRRVSKWMCSSVALFVGFHFATTILLMTVLKLVFFSGWSWYVTFAPVWLLSAGYVVGPMIAQSVKAPVSRALATYNRHNARTTAVANTIAAVFDTDDEDDEEEQDQHDDTAAAGIAHGNGANANNARNAALAAAGGNGLPAVLWVIMAIVNVIVALQLLFVAFKAEGAISVSWFTAFAPTWIGIVVLYQMISGLSILGCVLGGGPGADRIRPVFFGCLCSALYSSPVQVFLVLLVLLLEDAIQISFVSAFIPLFVWSLLHLLVACWWGIFVILVRTNSFTSPPPPPYRHRLVV